MSAGPRWDSITGPGAETGRIFRCTPSLLALLPPPRKNLGNSKGSSPETVRATALKRTHYIMIWDGRYKGGQPASSLHGLAFTPVWLLGREGPEGGGSSGIRTHGPREQATVLKTAAIDRSAMLPMSLVPALSPMFNYSFVDRCGFYY
jgi:hypothetical protein